MTKEMSQILQADVVLEVQGLERTFVCGSETCHALQNISFSIESGEFVVIQGRSGSGKTTLFNILSGLDDGYHGYCKICGNILSEMKEEQRSDFRLNHLGVIFQDFNLMESLTVQENLKLQARLQKTHISDDLFQRALKTLELEDKCNAYPTQLSGGQKQRTAIGRVLLCKSDLILADEPTGNLDSVNAQKVMNLFKKAKKFNKTVLMVTHDDQLARQADRILRLEDGKLVSDVTC